MQASLFLAVQPPVKLELVQGIYTCTWLVANYTWLVANLCLGQ